MSSTILFTSPFSTFSTFYSVLPNLPVYNSGAPGSCRDVQLGSSLYDDGEHILQVQGKPLKVTRSTTNIKGL